MGEMSVASATHGRRMGKFYRGAVGWSLAFEDGVRGSMKEASARSCLRHAAAKSTAGRLGRSFWDFGPGGSPIAKWDKLSGRIDSAHIS
jgi:hypothetical protein